MILTYQYRLLPTKAQLAKFVQMLELCCLVYNVKITFKGRYAIC